MSKEKDNSNVYCDIKVTNSYGNVTVRHYRVPYDHVEWIKVGDHLTVEILKTYKVDKSYTRKGRRNYDNNKTNNR